MRPVLCMITPAGAAADDGALVERAAAAARAGVHLIQVRQPDRDARPLIALVEQMVAVVRRTRTRVVVNDRLDVALAAGADGVHLRGDSMPAARVRRVTPPGFLLGRSVHSAEEAAEVENAGGLDYLVFGTLFPTVSKPGAPLASIDGLGAACVATRLPVLAVGGITAERAAPVASAGAAGIAAIGLFAEPRLDELSSTVERVRLAFDTPPSVP